MRARFLVATDRVTPMRSPGTQRQAVRRAAQHLRPGRVRSDEGQL